MVVSLGVPIFRVFTVLHYGKQFLRMMQKNQIKTAFPFQLQDECLWFCWFSCMHILSSPLV